MLSDDLHCKLNATSLVCKPTLIKHVHLLDTHHRTIYLPARACTLTPGSDPIPADSGSRNRASSS